ncbi:MAG: imelysin family protein, partial [Bacteroidota bacterium]
CKKHELADDHADEAAVEVQVLTDFANVLANPTYKTLQAKANELNMASQALSTSTTEANLTIARNAWRDTRAPWESSECFLFGPAADFNYDPAMDDWPVNRTDMDSLLASSNPLTLSSIDALPTTLKGFHAIEYMLFGNGGSKTAASFTAREKLYLVSLTQSLYNTTTALCNSWDAGQPGNFTNHLITAGNGSTYFGSRKDAFTTIVGAMAGICDEVANGKMQDPLIKQDSTLEESQFSHNSTTDFRNNISGILNAYMAIYTTDGHGLNEIVAAKNLSLDNTIQSQISAAVGSLNSIGSNYGAAIYTQQVQIHNAQAAINTLKTTLEKDLMDFVQINIKD